MDTDSYLDRIKYRGPLEPTAEPLFGLHRAHMLAVPFENLDIHLGRPIILEEPRLYEKIVNKRRGGFCYELNGCFAGLLRRLGFKVDMLSARVVNAEGGFDPPFDHMALLVHLEERWLADVGFGDSFIQPLLLDETGEQLQDGRAYRIDRDESNLVLLRREDAGDWEPQYQFTLDPYQLDNFEEMCRYHQTSAESIFTQRRTCSRATPHGRITLTGMKLITTTELDRREREMTGASEYARVLRDYFGIELGREDVERLIS